MCWITSGLISVSQIHFGKNSCGWSEVLSGWRYKMPYPCHLSQSVTCQLSVRSAYENSIKLSDYAIDSKEAMQDHQKECAQCYQSTDAAGILHAINLTLPQNKPKNKKLRPIYLIVLGLWLIRFCITKKSLNRFSLIFTARTGNNGRLHEHPNIISHEMQMLEHQWHW